MFLYLFCRTYYFSTFENKLDRSYHSMYQCCRGWTQVPQESGCLRRKKINLKTFQNMTSFRVVRPYSLSKARFCHKMCHDVTVIFFFSFPVFFFCGFYKFFRCLCQIQLNGFLSLISGLSFKVELTFQLEGTHIMYRQYVFFMQHGVYF